MECLHLKNLGGVFEIIAGLSSVAVHRLQKTRSKLLNSARQDFERLERLVARKMNYRTYRRIMSSSSPPYLPFLGVVLADLTFLEEGNDDMVERTALVGTSRWYNIIVQNQFSDGLTLLKRHKRRIAA